MTPDHEAAKKRAEAECRSPLFPGQDTHNLARAYLDLLAQRDEATELLRDAIDQLERPDEMAQVVREEVRAFLAKHRKTGATDGK